MTKLPFLVLLAAVALDTAARADRGITFGSTLGATNLQSGGSDLDGTFTFELGTFAGLFIPDDTNTDLWSSFWVSSPNSSTDPFSGASVMYSTAEQPFGRGPANRFQGSVTLDTNTSPFGATDTAFIWGFDIREGAGDAEWVLLSNDSWTFPAVDPGELEIGNEITWSVADSGTTTVLGRVNPAYDISADPARQAAHLQTAFVSLPAAVPEPSATALIAFAAIFLIRRR